MAGRNKKPANYGKKYKYWELLLIRQVRETPKAKEWLAKALKRTPHAIDFVYRWFENLENLEPEEELSFPEGAYGNIKTLATKIIKKYGNIIKGIVVI